MKTKLLVLLMGIISAVAYAQPHQAFNYQTVVHDVSGNLISNQAVSMRISIINGNAGGSVVYQETHANTTNEFGLITLTIGEGTPVAGYDFEDVDWSDQFKFIGIEIDPAGGTNYISMGISELLSVPYALYSERSMDNYWESNSNAIHYNYGNVGIGTDNPLNKLEVNGSTLIGSVSKGIRFRNDGIFTDIESLGTDLAINYFGQGNTYMNVTSGKVGIGTHDPAYPLHLMSSSDVNWLAGFHNANTSASSNGLFIRADGGDPLWVKNADKTIFSVKQNGHVGIGTGYPDSPLEIITGGNEDVIRINRFTGWPVFYVNASYDESASLSLYKFNVSKVHLNSGGISYINGGSLGLGTTATSNAKLQLEGEGTYDGIVKLNNIGTDGASFFLGTTNSAWGGGVNANRFVMGHGAPASANIDITINESGQVGIATLSPTQLLDVNGKGRFRGLSSGVVSNAVYQTSDGTLITGNSDIRLKENIEPLQKSLEKVMQLNGVTFSWKADSTKRKSIGFIAQDFEKVVPELTFTNQTDGYKGINYAEVSALLVEAIKEQQKIIEALEARIEQLENQ